eukprot:6437309-Prymnesium_polylepis.1
MYRAIADRLDDLTVVVGTTPCVGISKVPLEQDEKPAARSPQGAGATQETTDKRAPTRRQDTITPTP